jgi:hypothetical protein
VRGLLGHAGDHPLLAVAQGIALLIGLSSEEFIDFNSRQALGRRVCTGSQALAQGAQRRTDPGRR